MAEEESSSSSSSSAPSAPSKLLVVGPVSRNDIDFQRLLECAICCDYLQKVNETPCCHSLYCENCLAGWARQNSSCPSCRQPLDLAKVLHNIPIQRFVDAMPFDCPFKLQGCGARPPRSELEKHKKLCTFRPEVLAEADKKRRQEVLRLRQVVEQDEKDWRAKHGNNEQADKLLDKLATDMLQLTRALHEDGANEDAAKFMEKVLKWRNDLLAHKIISTEDLATTYELSAAIMLDVAKFDSALEHLTRALELHRQANLKTLVVAETLTQIGDVYVKLAKFQDAQKQYADALALARELDPKAVVAAHVLNSMGLVAKKCSEHKKAVDSFKAALEIVNANAPIWSEIVANLGDVYREEGLYKDARELYIQALHKLESQYGSNHPQIADVCNVLGMLAKKEGHYAEALDYYRTALKIGKHFLGKDHPNIGMYLTNVGDIYRKQGEFAKAEGVYMEAIATLEKALGPNHVDLADVLNSMGLVLKKRADYEAAEKLYRRAIDIVTKTFGEIHFKVGIYTNNLGDIYRKHNQFDTALGLYRKALNAIEKTLGANHSEAAEVLHNIGLVEHQLGNYQHAIELYGRALAIVKKEFGDRHYKIGLFKNSAGLAEAMLSHYDKAYETLKDALHILIDTMGAEHPETADCYSNLGDVCMKLVAENRGGHARRQQLLEEAKKYFTAAEKIISKTLGPNHTKCKQFASLLYIIDNYDTLA